VLGPVWGQGPPLARRPRAAVEERESVDAGIRHVEFLDSEIAAVERLIAQQALAWPEIRRLMTVPGVNLICAATFIAAVGDPRRFFSSRKLVAHLGLSASPGKRRRAAAGSANAAAPPPAGRWSRPPGARFRAAARLL
jgi:transposase